MKYDREHLKFVFIGAGSSVFTMRLIGDILKEDSILSGELVLVDIDPVVLEESYTSAKELLQYAKRNFSIRKEIDFRRAIDNADFVFLTIATGAYPRWQKDIEVCTPFGVLQSVGDTIGPGGIIRALRTIPVVLEIAHEMERRCPNAYLINYANPEGALCLAIQKYTRVRSFGLCHGTPDTAALLAKRVFGVEPSRFSFRAAGINHLTWFTDMSIDGEDVYPLLDEKLVSSGFHKEEPISYQLFKTYGKYPAPGDRHVGEFFPFFMKQRVLEEQNYTWKNNDFIVVDGWREDARKQLEYAKEHPEGYETFLEGSGETATDFIRSLITGENAVEMVNFINRGFIENIPDGIIVEIPTFIDGFGLHPQKIGKLPEGIAAKCDALGREYILIVEAAAECSYDKALQAMYLDPLAANCDYPKELLDALIRANLDLLPSQWGKMIQG